MVGIGASAGGVEALEAMLRPIPADCGLAFVIVTHLAQRQPSLLPEIVARFTPMPVRVAQDGLLVEANHVYVGAPDVTLTIAGGRLTALSEPGQPRVSHVVDAFFRSLADD